jgi:hypothetical protein
MVKTWVGVGLDLRQSRTGLDLNQTELGLDLGYRRAGPASGVAWPSWADVWAGRRRGREEPVVVETRRDGPVHA